MLACHEVFGNCYRMCEPNYARNRQNSGFTFKCGAGLQNRARGRGDSPFPNHMAVGSFCTQFPVSKKTIIYYLSLILTMVWTNFQRPKTADSHLF